MAVDEAVTNLVRAINQAKRNIDKGNAMDREGFPSIPVAVFCVADGKRITGSVHGVDQSIIDAYNEFITEGAKEDGEQNG